MDECDRFLDRSGSLPARPLPTIGVSQRAATSGAPYEPHRTAGPHRTGSHRSPGHGGCGRRHRVSGSTPATASADASSSIAVSALREQLAGLQGESQALQADLTRATQLLDRAKAAQATRIAAEKAAAKAAARAAAARRAAEQAAARRSTPTTHTSTSKPKHHGTTQARWRRRARGRRDDEHEGGDDDRPRNPRPLDDGHAGRAGDRGPVHRHHRGLPVTSRSATTSAKPAAAPAAAQPTVDSRGGRAPGRGRRGSRPVAGLRASVSALAKQANAVIKAQKAATVADLVVAVELERRFEQLALVRLLVVEEEHAREEVVAPAVAGQRRRVRVTEAALVSQDLRISVRSMASEIRFWVVAPGEQAEDRAASARGIVERVAAELHPVRPGQRPHARQRGRSVVVASCRRSARRDRAAYDAYELTEHLSTRASCAS